MNSQEATYTRTADGSLTLSISRNGVAESMHASAGAWGETLHTYLPVLQSVHGLCVPQTFMSLGLGLGYVEIMTAAYFINNPKIGFSLCSFESEEWLTSHFFHWLGGANNEVYDDIAARVSSYFKTPAALTKSFLNDALKSGVWTVRGALNDRTVFENKFSGLFYDGFTKVTPELWAQPFLDWFLDKAAGKDCVFASYSARSALKVALRRAQFEVKARAGWAGKRECTLATRGLFARKS